MGEARDGVVHADQTGFAQDEFPVVETVRAVLAHVTAQQGQAQGAGVIDVGGQVDEVLAGPPQGERSGKGVAGFDQEDHQADQRHEHLHQTASEGGHQAAEGAEENMPGLVEGQVDQMPDTLQGCFGIDAGDDEFDPP
ncbi:hypothetical protein DESC_480193 [Desulfosarcina cetonica]|nr:hypothetical protein DESC_480193 [Desulfosarcina cetonica]